MGHFHQQTQYRKSQLHNFSLGHVFFLLAKTQFPVKCDVTIWRTKCKGKCYVCFCLSFNLVVCVLFCYCFAFCAWIFLPSLSYSRLAKFASMHSIFRVGNFTWAANEAHQKTGAQYQSAHPIEKQLRNIAFCSLFSKQDLQTSFLNMSLLKVFAVRFLQSDCRLNV